MFKRFARRVDRCRCGQPAFFQNSLCMACQTPLGYDPSLGAVRSVELDPDSQRWKAEDGQLYARCANLEVGGCNWLVSASSPGAPEFCAACRLNRTIPPLDNPLHGERWHRIEAAKRRVVASLLKLRLPVPSREDDPENGLVFDFLAPLPEGPSVMTGHSEGVITLNIEEADDVQRETVRNRLHESYRTLLGHFRHEVGHYYWDHIIAGSPRHGQFRELFGDEQQDYMGALERHYREGPQPDWQLQFVSAYASSHPWEDWAETWAHYLHMVDTLDAAVSLGMHLDTSRVRVDDYKADVLLEAPANNIPDFLPLINEWVRLTVALNELSDTMGQPRLYPFVLAKSVVTKLHFVHLAVYRNVWRPGTTATPLHQSGLPENELQAVER